jgi:hypothetical protein
MPARMIDLAEVGTVITLIFGTLFVYEYPIGFRTKITPIVLIT